MADVMKFRLTVEVMVATHESERAVRRHLKALVRAALPMGNHRAALHPIDAVLDLAVRIRTEDAFPHSHGESGCRNYGEAGWSCGRMLSDLDKAFDGTPAMMHCGTCNRLIVVGTECRHDTSGACGACDACGGPCTDPGPHTTYECADGTVLHCCSSPDCATALQFVATEGTAEDLANLPLTPIDLAEDYPGQRITGPDFDTRDREGDPNPLAAIVALLDGQTWDADTLERIADTCRAAGYTIGGVE
jgi:hypothetical protein